MDSPPFLIDQYARQRGLSAAMAKRAILLEGCAAEGRTLQDSAIVAGMSISSARQVARKLILDFADYRPYAKMEEKGHPRPAPYIRQDLKADDLPLFGGEDARG